PPPLPANREAERLLRLARLLTKRGYPEQGRQKYSELARKHPATPEGILAGTEVILYRIKTEGATPEVDRAARAFLKRNRGRGEAVRVRKALLERLIAEGRYKIAEQRLIAWEVEDTHRKLVETLYETLALKKAAVIKQQRLQQQKQKQTLQSIRRAIAQKDRSEAESLLSGKGNLLAPASAPR
ncbi:MAG: hypothetical protein V3S64_00865, partial [bacterium]